MPKILNRLLAEGKLRRHSTSGSYTEALGVQVEVELVQAIGRGDECCEFSIKVARTGE